MKELKNMNLGIDISQTVYKGTGVARFTAGLINAILDFDVDNRWTFFFSALRQNLDTEIEAKIRARGFRLVKWKFPPTLLSFLWNDLHMVTKFLNFNFEFINSLDWFITSDWTEPALAGKKATVVHDLVYLRFPETVDPKILATQRKRLTWVRDESALIFADSQATAKDLVTHFRTGPERIIVNYPGVTVNKPLKEQINSTLKKYNLDKPFILTVGKMEPRKNISRLLEAFNLLDNKNIDLAVVGPKGWETGYRSVNHAKILQNSVHVKFLGYLSDPELYSLYSSCLFFVMPSLWEGFGYPVVEAMKLGVPVATSDTSSLAEVAGNSALLFNPNDVNDIAKAIHKLSSDEKLRQSLTKKGLERGKMFTWENYYKKMLSALTQQL